MIDLQEIAFALNEYLGRNKFALYLNTNGAPAYDDKRIIGTVNIGVIPYGFSTDEIEATSLNITFTFDLPCGTDEDDITRDKALFTFAEKLLGWKKLKIAYTNGDSYFLNTFFEMQPPGQPYVDSGKITQQIVISGNALLQSSDCGAIVGNNEIVYINGQKVLKTDKTSATSVSNEPQINISLGSYVPELQAVSHVTTVTLNCLYTGTEIDKKLWSIGEGFLSDPNERYILKTELLGAEGEVVQTSEKTCALISVSNMSNAGIFNSYSVAFQVVQED